jgi:hypothetical protein
MVILSAVLFFLAPSDAFYADLNPGRSGAWGSTGRVQKSPKNSAYWSNHQYGYWNGQRGYWKVTGGSHVFVVVN